LRSTAPCARSPACSRRRSLPSAPASPRSSSPKPTATKRALVDGIDVYAVPTLCGAIAVLLGHGATFLHRGATLFEPEDAGAVGDFAVNGVPGGGRSRTRNWCHLPASDHAGETIAGLTTGAFYD